MSHRTKNIFKDKFWKKYYEEFVNNDQYWYVPKGLAITEENLRLIYQRLKLLRRYEGQSWSEVQKEYTDLLRRKRLIHLRKSRYTKRDYSAISRVNKVIFTLLGFAWVDLKSSVFITPVGRKFIQSRGSRTIIEQQILKYQFHNPSFPKFKEIKVFPHLFLVDLLLNFPENGISKEEYMLFVSRVKSNEELERTRELIIRYRDLDLNTQRVLWNSLKNVPIVSKGKFSISPRRKSILNTIELNASYALDFLSFPFYIQRRRINGQEYISIDNRYWRYASDLVRQYHKESCYIEFNSEKEWFSHYGDPARKGNIKDALEYYETVSKVPQAIELYKTALARGIIKGKEALKINEYADLRFKEKMLEDFLEINLDILEKGLKLKQRQYPTIIGSIDILAIDINKHYVVIELKKGKASDRAVGQLLRYMGYIEKELAKGKVVRGMIVSESIDRKLKYAVKATRTRSRDIKLFQFKFVGRAKEIRV